MTRNVAAKVDVIASLDAAGEIVWKMQSSHKKDNKLVFANQYIGDEYLITFEIDDKTGLDLIYPTNLDDAMWVSAGVQNGDPVCPELTACYNDVFKAVSVAPTGNPKKLTVRNKNNLCENIAFALRYIPKGKNQKDPRNFVIYDPISENKNGGTLPPNTKNYFTMLIGAAAVAALAYVAYEVFFEK